MSDAWKVILDGRRHIPISRDDNVVADVVLRESIQRLLESVRPTNPQEEIRIYPPYCEMLDSRPRHHSREDSRCHTSRTRSLARTPSVIQ